MTEIDGWWDHSRSISFDNEYLSGERWCVGVSLEALTDADCFGDGGNDLEEAVNAYYEKWDQIMSIAARLIDDGDIDGSEVVITSGDLHS